MGEILPNLPGKIILDDKAPQFLPLMQLQQQPPQPRVSAPLQPQFQPATR